MYMMLMRGWIIKFLKKGREAEAEVRINKS
jgi:hypothetical protein